MTTGANVVTRWLVVSVLGAATLGMFLISMRGNFLYGYSIGQSEEKRTLFGWANVAADVWKSFGLIAVTMLWRNRNRHAALAGTLAWLVCLCSGLNSAIGLYVQDRSTVTGTREAHHSNYNDAQAEVERLTERLRGLPPRRSVGELDALIAAALAQPIVVGERVRGSVAVLSNECRKLDARTALPCGEINNLRNERASAEEARKLEDRLQQLQTHTAMLRERGHSVTPDPVGEFYAWATRGLLSVRDVGFGFPLFFALLIEIVSAFGPVTVVRFAELSFAHRTPSDIDALQPVMTGHALSRPALSGPVQSERERVAAWMAQRARPSTDGGAIGIETLYEDYRAWSAQLNKAAMSLALFGAEFDRLREMPELAKKIRKFGNRYYGLALSKTFRE
jgi:hypothetical protein